MIVDSLTCEEALDEIDSNVVSHCWAAGLVCVSGDIFKMMMTTGAELHRAPAGRVSDWHTAPRRQYVITLSGYGELEVAGGKKIAVGPGHIELVEDTTGKGHITRVTGTEERVTLQLPLTDQSGR
ncbi:MAG: hypothetical protein DMG12_09135 [Acidobacteria bacterium]|nr:MAG: hypothetical protein DMG12_09135 [Acidobacteriota bacterium]